MQSISFKLFTSIILLITLMSCGEIKKFGKKTDKMRKLSKKIYKNSAESTKNLCHAFIQGRQGNSSISRNDSLMKLVDPMSDFSMKLMFAGKFIQGFEFQLFTKNCGEGSKEYERLVEDSIAEFYRSVSSLSGRINLKTDYTKLFTSRKKKHNDEQVFAAIGLTMHKINRMQEYNKGTLQRNPKSLHSFLEETIKKDYEGKAVPHYLRDITLHSFKNIVLDLFEIKMNSLLVLALKEFAEDKDTVKGKRKRKMILYVSSFGRLGKIALKSEYDKREVETQKRINYYLTKSLDTYNYLHSVGRPVKFQKKLRHIFKNIMVSKSQKTQSLSTAKGKNMVKFISLMDEVNQTK
ncbi:hypothetical protein N9N67_05165 [Bacteriovoracaceae bacterium]|nr:hypothetical protein [Bacteriovoracaceae bacterium]